VIIQKDRISAAACFLPLTTNPALARQLGTRHRAAIGITEETDCLSLVVSEETGRMSVAAFGELSQGLSPAEVVDRINQHFGVRQPTTAQPEDFAGDIPLHTEPSRKPPTERVHP
jgi:diadenylate cyclase